MKKIPSYPNNPKIKNVLIRKDPSSSPNSKEIKKGKHDYLSNIRSFYNSRYWINMINDIFNNIIKWILQKYY